MALFSQLRGALIFYPDPPPAPPAPPPESLLPESSSPPSVASRPSAHSHTSAPTVHSDHRRRDARTLPRDSLDLAYLTTFPRVEYRPQPDARYPVTDEGESIMLRGGPTLIPRTRQTQTRASPTSVFADESLGDSDHLPRDPSRVTGSLNSNHPPSDSSLLISYVAPLSNGRLSLSPTASPRSEPKMWPPSFWSTLSSDSSPISNNRVDNFVPARVLFFLGFICGPWCWLIGAFYLRRVDGEIYGLRGNVCRCTPSSLMESGKMCACVAERARWLRIRGVQPTGSGVDVDGAEPSSLDSWVCANRMMSALAGLVIVGIVVATIVVTATRA
jgi:hypothetical protein